MIEHRVNEKGEDVLVFTRPNPFSAVSDKVIIASLHEDINLIKKENCELKETVKDRYGEISKLKDKICELRECLFDTGRSNHNNIETVKSLREALSDSLEKEETMDCELKKCRHNLSKTNKGYLKKIDRLEKELEALKKDKSNKDFSNRYFEAPEPGTLLRYMGDGFFKVVSA